MVASSGVLRHLANITSPEPGNTGELSRSLRYLAYAVAEVSPETDAADLYRICGETEGLLNSLRSLAEQRHREQDPAGWANGRA